MTRISPRHPRYESLRTRARLGQAMERGLIVPEGLIAYGRGEAFDYLLGERSTPSASRAAKVAARWLKAARWPVISVNGNVAALEAPAVARLVRSLPNLQVEVNLFHRTPGRARLVARELRRAGVANVLGVRPTARIAGLPSDRALVDRRGIARADVCLVPLEDGDRTLALRHLGKKVIAIDLNPWSRTALSADLPIIDELHRAFGGIYHELDRRRRFPPDGTFVPFDARRALEDAYAAIRRRIIRS